MSNEEWAIQQIAKLSGLTSRTLRHYGDIGLLSATRVGHNGQRFYDERALVRLQRILLLRDLGVGLAEIARVLDGDESDEQALVGHLRTLGIERERLDRRIAAVEGTIEKLIGGERIMAEQALDGFDHTQHRAEVEERWGEESWAAGDEWWREKSAESRAAFTGAQRRLGADWATAAASGVDPSSEAGQELARRQFDWLCGAPGPHPTKQRFIGLGELYATDERFASQLGGQGAAEFARDAMAVFAERQL